MPRRRSNMIKAEKNTPLDAVLRSVVTLCGKAMGDYASARTMIETTPDLFGVTDCVCFSSQQIVEKYTKAFLTTRRISYIKTHNIIDLAFFAKHNKGNDEGEMNYFFEFFNQLDFMTSYADNRRYSSPSASTREALYSFKMAMECIELISSFSVAIKNTTTSMMAEIDRRHNFKCRVFDAPWFKDIVDIQEEIEGTYKLQNKDKDEGAVLYSNELVEAIVQKLSENTSVVNELTQGTRKEEVPAP